jgi:hypothetical protein
MILAILAIMKHSVMIVVNILFLKIQIIIQCGLKNYIISCNQTKGGEMKDQFYKAVEIKDGNSTEPVQYVGVYALNWQREWGEPEWGFVEHDPPQQPSEGEIEKEAKKRYREGFELIAHEAGFIAGAKWAIEELTKPKE